MADVKFVTLSQFEKDPKLQKEYGDYNKYLDSYVKSLRETPLFSAEQKVGFMSLPNSIRDSVWARSKEADKKADASEEAYQLAVRAEHDAKAAQEAAESYLEKMISSYEEGDSHITNAQNKLRELMKGTSNAELARELAGEHMVSDSKSSLRAFYSGMQADAMTKSWRG